MPALAHDPSLYERFCNGDNILFQKSDFENPASSPIFKELRQIPGLKTKLDAFAIICKRPMEQVPSLEEFMAGHTETGSTTATPAMRATSDHRKPAGQSNMDFIRASLNKAPPVSAAPRQKPQSSLAAKSMIPQAGKTGSTPNQTSTLRETGGNVWPSWATITVFGIILLFVAKSLMPA